MTDKWTIQNIPDQNAALGDYFGPGGFSNMRGYPVVQDSNELSHDETIAQKLWEISEEITGIRYGFN